MHSYFGEMILNLSKFICYKKIPQYIPIKIDSIDVCAQMGYKSPPVPYKDKSQRLREHKDLLNEESAKQLYEDLDNLSNHSMNDQIDIYKHFHQIIINATESDFIVLQKHQIQIKLINLVNEAKTPAIYKIGVDLINKWIINQSSLNVRNEFYTNKEFIINLLNHAIQKQNSTRKDQTQMPSLVLLESLIQSPIIPDNEVLIQEIITAIPVLYMNPKGNNGCPYQMLKLLDVILMNFQFTSIEQVEPILQIFKNYGNKVNQSDEFCILCKLGVIFCQMNPEIFLKFCDIALPDKLFELCIKKGNDYTQICLLDLLTSIITIDQNCYKVSNSVSNSIQWNELIDVCNSEFVYSCCSLLDAAFPYLDDLDQDFVHYLFMTFKNWSFKTEKKIIETISLVLPSIEWDNILFSIFLDIADEFVSSEEEIESLSKILLYLIQQQQHLFVQYEENEKIQQLLNTYHSLNEETYEQISNYIEEFEVIYNDLLS